jgi:hypothetical protein
MKAIILLVPLFIAQSVFAQGVTPKDWGLKEFHIAQEQLGDIYFYVSEKGIDQEKPLLFIAQGSGGLPTMILVQYGEKSKQLGTIPPDLITKFSDQYHVAYIGKAGTPFCDTVKVEEFKPLEILENYQPTEEYIRKCGMEWQIEASSTVIDTLCNMLPVSRHKIVALGISEGGRIVPRLAVRNNKITHLVSIVSEGLNQFYSSIINARIDAAAGKISHRQAQAIVDSLFAIYERIYRDPHSTEKSWYGHPYQRWASFCTDIPLEHLVKLDIPILMLNGSADRNSPILQADYVVLEFLRLGKSNLTYRVLPGCEHSLYEVVVENGEEKGISHRDEAFNMVADWIVSH